MTGVLDFIFGETFLTIIMGISFVLTIIIFILSFQLKKPSVHKLYKKNVEMKTISNIEILNLSRDIKPKESTVQETVVSKDTSNSDSIPSVDDSLSDLEEPERIAADTFLQEYVIQVNGRDLTPEEISKILVHGFTQRNASIKRALVKTDRRHRRMTIHLREYRSPIGQVKGKKRRQKKADVQ